MKQLCACWLAAMLFVAAIFGVCKYFGTPQTVPTVQVQARKPAAPTNLRIATTSARPESMLCAPDFKASEYYAGSWQAGFAGLVGAVGCATCHAEKIYRVKKGDNLTRIAKRLGLKGYKPLWQRNKKTIGRNPNYILPGQIFLIPAMNETSPSRASGQIGAEKQSKRLALAGCALSHPIPKEIAARVDCFLCHSGDAVAAEQARRLVATRRAARSPKRIDGVAQWSKENVDPFGRHRDPVKAIKRLPIDNELKTMLVESLHQPSVSFLMETGQEIDFLLFGNYNWIERARWVGDHPLPGEAWPPVIYKGRPVRLVRTFACFNLELIPVKSPAPVITLLIEAAPEGPQPPKTHIQAIPDNIAKGTCTKLHFISRNADNVNIDQGVGPVETTEGNRTVCPPDNTTYTIMAYGPGGQATDNTMVRVYEPVKPVEVGEQQAPPPTKAEPTAKPNPCQWKPTWEGNFFTGVVVNAEGSSSRVNYFGANFASFPDECYSQGTVWREGPSVEVVGWRGFENKDGHVDFHGQKYVVGGEIQHFGQWFKDIYDIRVGRKDGYTSTPGGYQASEKTGILNLAYSHTKWFPQGTGRWKSWQFGIQGDLDLKNGIKSSSFQGSPIPASRDPRLNASEVAAHLRAELASKGNWNPILQVDGFYAVGPDLLGIEPRAGLSYKNGLAEGLVGYRVNRGAENNTVGTYFNLSLDKTYDQLKAMMRETTKEKTSLTNPAEVVK